ncbi:hypothetical protein [Desulfuromonas acetoxidans]|uniref:Uncharacterized protein n=1 Tax=Desulfuromonas acetoxidans (strain DSM 684 / 11070) TaxID=281689 RepID=Q1K2J4_DESA6|nr:hypothetical protein [Desulfuromonas acetoxidans]EAT16887.1 hypothetical protein Dace_2139 [Desulfuromonas acetoxidans DSM 684]MBF0645517.1 hypothetical protein [Desulfuromonas acetoxidans]NVD23833.1 hypothetical protein [Desulfuromonas acetoxidans]NVE15770.1 hypothetical protein [Desulfuromonas acetoxidans]
MSETEKKLPAFTTKIDDVEVSIDMTRELIEELGAQKVNFLEVYRLIESFAHNLLENKNDSELRLENEDTKAFIDLDIKWQDEKMVKVKILDVDMKQVDQEGLPVRPKDAKFDFGKIEQEIEEEARALEAQAAQAR